jgi:glycosyltransferase involved in cell wall biosynthesis
LLSYSECFVFPSIYEGFGIPLLEAFYARVPVVSSSATCLPEVAGDAALFFDPYDVEDIAKQIKKILSDNDLRQMLITRGEIHVAKFTWEISAKKHMTLMKTVARTHVNLG